MQLPVNKTAIVDIDNTLWDFASVLYEKLVRINPEVPPPESWTEWEFWENYLPYEKFFQVVNEIHLEQSRYGVYPDARDFLEFLRERKYRIVIASHRRWETKEATLRWLEKHKLFFHELCLLPDKTKIFCPGCAVIDDDPRVLLKASESGLVSTGLEFPWNRNSRVKLFKSLSEVSRFLDTVQLI